MSLCIPICSRENALSEAVLRTCSRCGLVFDKDEGCNKMTCRCMQTQCYVCRAEGIGYEHFCKFVPFRSAVSQSRSRSQQPAAVSVELWPLFSLAESREDQPRGAESRPRSRYCRRPSGPRARQPFLEDSRKELVTICSCTNEPFWRILTSNVLTSALFIKNSAENSDEVSLAATLWVLFSVFVEKCCV